MCNIRIGTESLKQCFIFNISKICLMSFYSGYISRASSFLRLFRELKQGKHSCRHFLWRNYTQANIETKDKLAETCCLWKFVVQCIKNKT